MNVPDFIPGDELIRRRPEDKTPNVTRTWEQFRAQLVVRGRGKCFSVTFSTRGLAAFPHVLKRRNPP